RKVAADGGAQALRLFVYQKAARPQLLKEPRRRLRLAGQEAGKRRKARPAIAPDETVRVDFQKLRCPARHELFVRGQLVGRDEQKAVAIEQREIEHQEGMDTEAIELVAVIF